MSPAGDRFGRDRIIETLLDSDTVQRDIDGLLQALETFADGTQLTDDTTIASIECGRVE